MSDTEAKGVDPQLVGLILSNVADGVFTVDPDFCITYLNRAAEQITGFSCDETIGRPCQEVFSTDLCGQDCPLRTSIRTGETVTNVEIDIQTRNGKPHTVSVCTAPLIDAEGRFLGGVETFRDVTPLKALRREIAGRYTLHDIVTKNARLRQILEALPNIARAEAPVLIQGASGTGKDLLAAALHSLSPRAEAPFVKMSCSALPEPLLEAAVFGETRGEGDELDAQGRLHTVDGGTLVIDDIGACPLPLQAKLLRLLERREFAPRGSPHAYRADARVIATTSQGLEPLVEKGLFRGDLFYRLNVIQIRLPDLSERREDIPILVDHFLERLGHRTGRRVERLSEEAMAVLLRYPFPGNVRELENALEHACVVTRGPVVRPRDLPPHLVGAARAAGAPGRRRRGRAAAGALAGCDFEPQQMIECLERHQWNIPRAAKELGVHRTTLWRRVRRLGLGRG